MFSLQVFCLESKVTHTQSWVFYPVLHVKAKSKDITPKGKRTVQSLFPKLTNGENLKTECPRAPLCLQGKPGSSFSPPMFHSRLLLQHRLSILLFKELFEIAWYLPEHNSTACKVHSEIASVPEQVGAAEPTEEVALFVWQLPPGYLSWDFKMLKEVILLTISSKRKNTAKGTVQMTKHNQHCTPNHPSSPKRLQHIFFKVHGYKLEPSPFWVKARPQTSKSQTATPVLQFASCWSKHDEHKWSCT